MKKNSVSRRELTPRGADHRPSTESNEFGSESDIVSFWLLLLFVAVFFGIAAEEANRPFFLSGTSAAHSPSTVSDLRSRAAQDFDLTSRSRSEKTEVPATGK